MIYTVFGHIFFLLPGYLLSGIFFPRTHVRLRAISTILFSSVCIGCVSYARFNAECITVPQMYLVWFFLSLFFFIGVLWKKIRIETYADGDSFFLLFSILIAAAVRVYFYRSISHYASPYDYIGHAIHDMPDVGFFTGMIADHAKYYAAPLMRKLFHLLAGNGWYGALFFLMIVYQALVYELGCTFRSRSIARLAILVMAVGPFEIIHSSRVCLGHSLAYCAFFLLLLLYKKKERAFFWFVFSVCIVVMISYYTGTLVVAIVSLGFVLMEILSVLKKRGFRNATFRVLVKRREVQVYALIAGAMLLYLFLFSRMENYTVNLICSTEPAARFFTHITSVVGETTHFLYSDPTVYGLSALNWQIVLFLLCGSTCIVAGCMKRVKQAIMRDLIMIGGPVLLLAGAFIYAGYPIRAFDYGAIIFILYFFVPQRVGKIVFACLVLLVYLLSFKIMHDKKIFFEISPAEISASAWVKANCTERLYADEPFVNQVIARKYYNVTGSHDFASLTQKLFYAEEEEFFNEAISYLRQHERIRYIAITERMRTLYLLMLDHPQEPIRTVPFFEKTFPVVYDNGDVKIYDIHEGLPSAIQQAHGPEDYRRTNPEGEGTLYN